MRILVYGTGVLGCNLARDLHIAGKDVTLLARGLWAKTIKDQGLRIKHLIKTTVDRIPVIESLGEDDTYDVVFVVMQYTQLDSIAPILLKNVSQNIIFIGNNMEAKEYEQKLTGRNVWFGFSSSAGRREETRVNSISMHKITVGSAVGPCKEEVFIRSIFAETKMKLTIMSDMDEWLKTHIAFILPLANACYKTNGNLKEIKNDKVYINQIIDEMLANYETLMKKGYKIVPYSELTYVTVNRKKCYKFIRLLCVTFLGKIAVCDHAMSATGEMKKLQEKMDTLI